MEENVPTCSVIAAGEVPWELRRRGFKDSLRHDERVKDAIKKNLRELVAEEAIISSDRSKKVRIPIRYLDQYRFKYGNPQNSVGQGKGNQGDVVPQSGHEGAGTQPGEHVLEVEVSVEELIKMMLEDLSLPWLDEKPERATPVVTHRFTDVRRTGSVANLDKRRTLMANIKRNAARGTAKVEKLHDDDLRYKVWDEYHEKHTNAAVYMLMDCSASMTTSKKYVAKSFFFWMVRFLQLKYDNVAMVFIAHDVEAAIVPEEDFFHLSSAGGTRCSSAYVVAEEHIAAHHPKDSWNTYLFHFSDGDNVPGDNGVCKELVERLLTVCTMVGYAEIRYANDASFYGWVGSTSGNPSSLQKALGEIQHPRFVSETIVRKDEVYTALQNFLQQREATPA